MTEKRKTRAERICELGRQSIKWLTAMYALNAEDALRGAIRCRDRARRERVRADEAERLCVELVDTARTLEQCASVSRYRARMKGEPK